ncbi:MAG: BCCT family transporter, partial [Pseudomonadota bacterium]
MAEPQSTPLSDNDAPIDPPIVDLPIDTHDKGFYDGFSRAVTIPSKIIVTMIIVWALFSAASETLFVSIFGESAEQTLARANTSIISQFSGWYVFLVAALIAVSLVLVLVPKVGSLRMGEPGEQPEFSRFSWFAMLFGAGIGIGMLTFSTGEPLAHFQNNPDVIAGKVQAMTAENVRPAYLYTFLHWGFGAWCTYALVGLGIGYVAHRRGLPLTIRSALAPLFGKSMSGISGHIVDIVAVVATILGVAYTMSLGVQQFVAGLFRLTGAEWLMVGDAGSEVASSSAIVIALIALVGASTLSALSGVGRGIKWLSNINMTLSFALLALFATVGSGFYALELLGVGIWDYLVNLPQLSLTLFSRDGTEAADGLVDWQLGWSVSYWAWWIAFAPFVGMFIARISRGRTVREYILGVALVPSLMCFIWMALAGGTAIDLELNGSANGAIVGAAMADQLYATLEVLLSPGVMTVVSVLVVVLLMTYLVTSADSAILIINTINGAGEDEGSRRFHIIFWGLALALIVGSMLIVGGVEAIRITMILGALPFSFVLVAMCASICKAVILDLKRKRHGVPTTAQACEDWDGSVTPA